MNPSLIFISVYFAAKVSNLSLSTKLFAIFVLDYIYGMADNYLEKKYEDLQARKAKEQRVKQIAWKKRMDAYRKKLATVPMEGTLPEQAPPQSEGPAAERKE